MRRIILTIACVLLVLQSSLTGYALTRQSAQSRVGVNIATVLDERTTLYFDDEYRYGDDDFQQYAHAEIGLSFAWFSWLDAGFYIRNIANQTNNSWIYELRPFLEATPHWTRGHVYISSRNRMEARIIPSQRNEYRYRNRVKVGFPFAAVGWKWKPYIADEIFVDINDESFEQNRVYAGLEFWFAKHVGMDLYYFWQCYRPSVSNKNKHIAGLKLKLAF